MKRIASSLLLASMWVLAAHAPSAAQGGVVDLSKQTGPSKFVYEANGTPAQLGVAHKYKEEDEIAAGEGSRPSAPANISRSDSFGGGAPDKPTEGSRTYPGLVPGCGSGCSATSSKTVNVKAYTRKDGTDVSAHTRSAPGSLRARR